MRAFAGMTVQGEDAVISPHLDVFRCHHPRKRMIQ
jgi:hypothetical protein